MHLMNIYTFMGLLGEKPSLEIVDQAKTLIKSGEQVILHAIMETYRSDLISDVINELGVTPSNTNVRLVFEEDLQFYHVVNHPNIEYYNHGQMKTNASQEEHGFNDSINLDTGKFLFLMGKAFKHHRIGMLYELYRSGILARCDYSFSSLPGDYYEKQREFLPKLSDTAYRKFINNTERTLDDISIISGDNYWHYDGLPTDKQLYTNTSFSLISETNCDPMYWGSFTTEKTWRTISNHHAFVLVAYKNTYDFLESVGIDTFQYMLKHKKDSMCGDINTLIRLTSENIAYLLDNIHRFKDRIIESIKHNNQIYLERVDKFRQVISKDIESEVLVPYFKSKPIVTV